MGDSCAIAQPVTPTTSTCPWWKKALTESDNQTWDIGKISWAISTLAVLGLAGWHEGHKIKESIQQLGLSLTAIATGHGIGIGMKRGTEHQDGSNG